MNCDVGEVTERLDLYCIFWFKGASTSKVIGARDEMMMDGYDGQMIFGDLVGLKLPDILLTGEEKPRKNLTQETCPDRGSNPGPLRDKRACYHLLHSGGRKGWRVNPFSNPSVALPTSQFIRQPFRCFTYVTAHSSTLLSLLLRHGLFSFVTW